MAAAGQASYGPPPWKLYTNTLLIVSYYRGKDLICVARVRNGFVPASRRQVFEKIRHLVSPTMPVANLPDTHKSRWGDELPAEKMKECIWLRPEAVAQIEFLEWTAGNRLRHAEFAGLLDEAWPTALMPGYLNPAALYFASSESLTYTLFGSLYVWVKAPTS